MNNIEVGEYIRTKDGYIGKFIDYDEELEWLTFDNSMIVGEFEDVCNEMHIITWETFKEQVLKHSKNLIDLIEVGDYVNGQLIEKIYKKEKDKLFFEYLENEDGSYEIMGMFEIGNIKSIVTKEQFERASYKVEE